MIVKDATETIRACLTSVVGVVDQIVIADTGCSDDTCAIASEFGARILSFPWQEDFAKARNAAIAGATTDWVLVLDADEELDPEAARVMPDLLEAFQVGGYLVPIWEYVAFVTGSAWTATILPNKSTRQRAQGAPSYLVNTLCRLFRRRDNIFFTGRVHEMVQPQVEAAGFLVKPAGFRIHHYGHLAGDQVLRRKRIFYHDLLHKRLADDESDVTTLTMCGLDEWEVHHRPLEALRYFRQALAIRPNGLETWLLTAKVLCAIKQYKEALLALDMVEATKKDEHLQHTLRGDALAGLERFEEARSAYARALLVSPNDRLLQCKQDYVAVELGDAINPLPRLQKAAVDLPGNVAIHECFLNACIRAGRIVEAADEAERFTKMTQEEAFLLRAAKLRAQLQQWHRAEPLARECARLYPDYAAAQELLMMCSVALGRVAEAAVYAEHLAALVREPRAYLRAAAIYVQAGDEPRAQECLQRGLRSCDDRAGLESALLQMRQPGCIAARDASGHTQTNLPPAVKDAAHDRSLSEQALSGRSRFGSGDQSVC